MRGVGRRAPRSRRSVRLPAGRSRRAARELLVERPSSRRALLRGGRWHRAPEPVGSTQDWGHAGSGATEPGGGRRLAAEGGPGAGGRPQETTGRKEGTDRPINREDRK